MTDNKQPRPLPPREKWKQNAEHLMALIRERAKPILDQMEHMTHFGSFGAAATFPLVDEWAANNSREAKVVLRAALGIALCGILLDKWQQQDADDKRDQEANHGRN